MSVSVMKKLTVLAFHRDADTLLRRLVKLRCVEVRSVDCSDESLRLQRKRADEELKRSESLLKDIREALPILTKYSTEKRGIGRSLRSFDEADFNAHRGRSRGARIVSETLAHLRRREELEREKAGMRAQTDALTPWLEFDLPLEQTETARTRTVLGCCPPSVKLDALQEALDELNAFAETVCNDKNGVYLAVTYLKSAEDEARLQLSKFGFLQADLPRGEGTAQQQSERLELYLDELDAQMQDWEERARDLAEELETVEILHDLTDTDRKVAELRQKLAHTESCTVLEGWIPSFAEATVKQTLERFDCAYEMQEPEDGEEPPVLLRNNGFATNFEWVVGMYSYPRYGRFDPTVVMSIFYFLIFGLMFADVGYGLLLVLGGFGGAALLKPKESTKRMLCMFGYCGLSTMLMGVLFGGWFGDLPVALMGNLLGVSVDTEAGRFFGGGLWFNPLDRPLEFLILALAVGGVHLIAGMAVRFYILCKDGKAAEAICTILPYWVLFAGLLTLLIHREIGLAVAIAGGGLILILGGYGIRNPFKRLLKGLGGLYRLVSYVSDLLSYSRILALGLVAAVIAKVVNMITVLGNRGVFGAIVMVVVLVAGHLLNLAINVLGSFVHTSRLQYMEFFGKFYEDGGRPFAPAAPTEDYSREQEKTDTSVR